MSINNRGLAVLRNVREVLVGQFADLNLVSLSSLGEAGRNFERIAMLIDTVAPMLLRFGSIVKEATGYLDRQKNNARRFRTMMMIIIVFIIFACISIIYSYSQQPGMWYTRATYFLSVIALCIVIVGFLRIMRAMVDERTKRILAVSTSELERYKANLSDNLFIRFANERLRGAEGVRAFKEELKANIQRETDDAAMFDFCKEQKDEQSVASQMCTVLSLCESNSTSVTLADVLRQHFRNGLGKPCGEVLRSLFRSLQDIKDGNKVTNLDQYYLWSQITKGAETFRSLLQWDSQARQDASSLDGRKTLKIIDDEVVKRLQLDLTEVSSLAVPAAALAGGTEVQAEDKGACWKACHDRGEECRWARYEDGKCTLGTQDFVPDSVASVFTLTDAAPSVDKGTLVRSGSADDMALVCKQGIPVNSLASLNPIVYAGRLTLDVASENSSVSVLSFPAPSNGIDVVPAASTLQRAALSGYKANEADTYAVLFKGGEAGGATVASQTTFCRKASQTDIVKLNPESYVATYQELEPTLRERILFAMENYQYRISLGKYRAYILSKLRDHYGPSFAAMTPHLIDTLTELEKAVAAAREAAKAQYNARYVTKQRFQARLELLTSRQRSQLSQLIADMASATYLHHRHFKPVYTDMDMVTLRIVLTHGVVLAFVAIIIFSIVTYRCYAEMTCDLWSIVRRAVVVCSVVTLVITLFISSYKKTIARRTFNRQVAETNGQALVQKTAELVSIWSGGSSFKLYATLYAPGRAITLGNSDSTPLISGSAGSPTEGLQPTTGTLDKPVTDVRSVRITLDSVVGAQVLKVRSVRVMDIEGGFAYTFRRSDAAELRPGQTIDLPVRQVASFFKGNPTKTFDLQVSLSEAVTDYSSVYLISKQIVETYDKCNSLSDARSMPFPFLDVVIMCVGIGAVLMALMYMFGVIRPFQKMRNVRTLLNVKRKVLLGDAAPEFESVITCCKTPDDVWEKMLNVGVVIVFVFAIYASFTVSNTIGDYKGGLYSSPEYADGKCVN